MTGADEPSAEPSGDDDAQTVFVDPAGATDEPPRAGWASDDAAETKPHVDMAAMVRERLFRSVPQALRIGRFTVLEEIGSGGMGMVYAAYDEKLDRKVAVKVLRDDQGIDEDALQRFEREAQAMARLSHPNVVTVHEVGQSDGEAYLAMEFIHGQSLAAWITTKPGWREVLEVFIQAGEGLIAAHDAKLVHRDLKPHNIMRDDSGVVKVLDFGLVRRDGDEHLRTHEHDPIGGSESSSALASSLTVTGTVMGTPAYMSPEQIRGELVDARSDQFSFCVAMFEALYGERPFDGPSLPLRMESIAQQRVRAVPPGSAVPSAVRKVLLRGLRADPEERWPSMAALLEPLRQLVAPRQSRWGAAAVLVGAFGVVAAVAATQYVARAERCAEPTHKLDGIWDDDRKRGVGEAFGALESPLAASVLPRVRQDLDAYAEGWQAMHVDACEASVVREEQSAWMMERRMACLQRAATSLRATVDTLADADEKVVSRAQSLTGDLPPLSRCADTDALAAEVEPPLPKDAAAVSEIREHLAEVLARSKGSQFERASVAMEKAQALLKTVEYGPVQTEVALREGLLLYFRGHYREAETKLDDALRLAARWRQWELLRVVSVQLMEIVGEGQGRLDEALRYWPQVEGLAQGNPRVEARSRIAYGMILREQGRYAEAEVEHRAALEALEQLLKPTHPRAMHARVNVAISLFDQERYEESEAEYRTLFSLHEQAGSADSVDFAQVRMNLGANLLRQGRLEEAGDEFRAAAALQERLTGPEHPTTLTTRGNLAGLLYMMDEYAEAEVQMRRVLAAQTKSLGADHTDAATTHANLAAVLDAQGNYEEAAAELRTSLRDETMKPTHPVLVTRRNSLGIVLENLGKLDEAEKEFRTVLALREEASGPDHPDTTGTRVKLASILLGLDRPDEALPLIEQAWARDGQDDVEPRTRADRAFVLAKVLGRADGTSRARAREMAELALSILRAVEDGKEGHAERIDEIERWLADNPG